MNTNENTVTGRIDYIDFLKFIGITGIILAHVGSPNWVMMLRSFDVPFMVILSAILGEKSFQRYKDSNKSSFNYCINRVKRLVIPTWIFLIFYFTICFFINGSFFELKYYIASFCLTKYGTGCVWVILVYIYCALLTPLYHKMKLSKWGVFSVIAIYMAYEVAYYFRIGIGNKIVDTTLYTIIPYGVLAYLGYNYFSIKRSKRYLIAIISAMVFVGFGIYYWNAFGYPQLVQIAKYPPRFYYLGFGIAVSFGLLLLCERLTLKIYNNKIICFISKHSMWIYLWHILVITLYETMKLPEIWYLKLLIVYILTIAIVFLQNKLLDKIKNP